MGTYVDRVSSESFVWGEQKVPSPSSGAYGLVSEKFDATMQTAEDMLLRLVGTNGDGGYLGRLYDVIEEFDAPEIDDFTVTIPNITIPFVSRPAPTVGSLDLDFPVFDKAPPSLATLPTIDTTGLTPGEAPDVLVDEFLWTEQEHISGVYAQLLSRLLTYLQAGSTGLSAAAEQAIIDRAQARQDIIDDKLERETLEFFSSRGFDLPTGVEDAATAYLAAERARNRTDLNEKVLIDQAERAMKNDQFIIGAAKDLEAVLIDHTNKINDRALDAVKAKSANAVAIFAESVKAYIAEEEGKLKNLSVQVEHLRGVVEANKGLVSLYSAEGEAYKVTIEGKAARNESVVKIFEAENSGFEAETRANTSAATVTIEEYKLRLQNADIQLRKAIAQVEAELKSYESESTLRIGVSKDMANIAMQCVASAYGAVNASAGISFGADESQTETFTHGETRGMSFDATNTLTEAHTFKED